MRQQRTMILVLFLLVAVGFAAGCGSSRSKNADFYNIRKTTLTELEKKHALELAHAYLKGETLPEDRDRYKRIYADEKRGVFVSLPRANQAALTGYGWGDSIQQALKNAADNLRRLAANEELDKAVLRVDVIDESTDERTYETKKHWKGDLSTQGAIFQTDPPVALLPQELRDWSVIDKKGRYSYSMMKKLLQHRGIGRVARDQIRADQLAYALFTTISFLDDGNGGVWNLKRGGRADGYDPTPERLKKSIVDTGEYLKQAVKEDGEFNYLYYPQTHRYSKSYNELRHAGTTFAMMQIYEITKDPEMLAAAKRALGWLQKHSRGPNDEDAKKMDWQALFDPKMEYAKLGGAGLSLLAFSWYTKATGDRQYLPLMEGYAKFIDYLMQPNGDVRMRYYLAAADQDKKDKPVLYYPGEAFFGLATLHAIDNNPHWIDVASKGIDYIADVRDAKIDDAQIPHDHWLGYAINEVHKFKPKANQVAHAQRIFKAMDAKFNDSGKDETLIGGYYRNPSSVATACRLEATGALYRLAQQLNDAKQRERYFEVLQKGAAFLMRNQYDDVNTMFFTHPKAAFGGYMFSYWSPEIQIDYVQHSVSALIQIYYITMERAGQVPQSPAAEQPEALKPAA